MTTGARGMRFAASPDTMDAQTRQILEWSGEPEKAFFDFQIFCQRYQEKTGQEFDLEPVNAKRLLSIFGNSFFLTRFLLKHPEEADGVVSSPCFETDKSIQEFTEELNLFIPNIFELPLSEFGKKLRFYKYREYLRLTAKDLSQVAGLSTVLNELSYLATALIQKTYEYFYARLSQELGEPETNSFGIIAQGKLGGMELNYSSDVDLQYVYQSDHGILKKSSLSPHEFFVKLAEKISHFLSEKTPEGFLYRVDLNLRPEGKSGTLANSLSAIELYYESFGAEWERQALIRVLPVGGNPELGKTFLKVIEPFVWRKSMDLGVIEKMKEMKQKIRHSIADSLTKGFHVKLGEGGIREIEFFVQTLQLLYGGRHPELREPSTLPAIQALNKFQFIPSLQASQLKEAYLFLRSLEHRLQMVEEAQTHRIPEDSKSQQALARRMGYFEEDPEKAREHLQDDLTHYTAFVKATFQDLFR